MTRVRPGSTLQKELRVREQGNESPRLRHLEREVRDLLDREGLKAEGEGMGVGPGAARGTPRTAHCLGQAKAWAWALLGGGGCMGRCHILGNSGIQAALAPGLCTWHWQAWGGPDLPDPVGAAAWQGRSRSRS